ncbi:hypothetical protein PFICI_07651 [Pestalotiopsis fici W106-1]|uniref:Uncharacterized protein n=1 Tax=Pestalotiopsis fici (strain W106-1 / CGMCC3.15140) TaxID=1229662 RepID=W3X3Y7_PESFW|nr:uncharacterized protein PFICI_07651 [Pestalotiopsis fici W106-1]ETS80122.1 hypothetical protein PFICI_07651 [Pestalotiopsis fici W106-1]
MFTDLVATIQEKWLVLATALTLAYVATKVRAYLRLRHIPGPPGSGFTDIAHIRACLGEHAYQWYTSVSDTYGPFARIGPNIVLTSSAEFWESANAKPGYKRSEWFYKAARFDWPHDNVFTSIDVDKHDAKRKMMAPGYSGRENLTLEADVDSCVAKLLQLVGSYTDDKHTGNGGVFDLGKKLQFMTLDVIGQVGFGKSFGLLDIDDDPDEFVRSTELGLRRCNQIMSLGISWINNILVLWSAATADPSKQTGFEKMLNISTNIVEGREREFRQNLQSKAGGVNERADMLASFMKNGLLGQELKTEALLQIVAGSDTTAGALRGTLLYLLTHPRVWRALQEEADAAVRNGTVPVAGSGDVISYAQTKNLPYLQAVVREGIRIWPPLTDPFARDVQPEGDEVVVDGKKIFLPGGTSVVPSWVSMHRDKSLYGEDVDVFRPERWLESEQPDKERLRAMRRTNDLMFGHGKFSCLGKPVAMIEIHKTVFELVRNFDMGLINPAKPWKSASLIGLWVISDMYVHASRRTPAGV